MKIHVAVDEPVADAMSTRTKLVEWLQTTPDAIESIQIRLICMDGRQYVCSLLSVLAVTECFDAYIWTVISENLFMTAIPINLPESYDIATRVFAHVTENDYTPVAAEAEFCCKYGIHPPIQIIDPGDDSGPPEPVPCEPEEQGILHELIVKWNGYAYRRNKSDGRGGYYYYCAVEGCKAGLHVLENGSVMEQIGVVHCCKREDEIVVVGQKEWRNFLENLAVRLEHRDTRSPLDVVLQMAEEDPVWRMIVEELSYDEIANMSGQASVDTGMLSSSPFDSYPLPLDFIKVHNVAQHPIVIMGSDFMLERARKVGWVLIDGTFKSAPRQFQQIVNILAEDPDKGIFIPIAHILLADKMQATYELAFDLLRTVVDFSSLRLVTCDFEKGLRNAIGKWISAQGLHGVMLRGCKFHFSQCLVRYVKTKYGLTEDAVAMLSIFYYFIYMDEATVNMYLDELSFRNHGMTDFVKYFRREWMSIFKEWNLSGCNEYIMARATNNAIESFNKQLNDLFTRNCPRIEKLINGLIEIHKNKRMEVEYTVTRDELKFERPIEVELISRVREVIDKYPLLPEFAAALQTQRSLEV